MVFIQDVDGFHLNTVLGKQFTESMRNMAPIILRKSY